MNEKQKMRIKTRIERNTLANLTFTLKELADERELMDSKWFAYRFMSPTAATAKFARLYKERLQRSLEVNRDRNMKAKDLDWADFWKGGATFVTCWRARKRADEFCIPYETYLCFAFDFAFRRKRRFEPQINQLHGGKNSREAWLIKFDDVLRETTWPSLCELDMPQYHADHFMDLAPQRDYREFVIATTSNSQLVAEPWKRIIERYCYQRNEMRLEHFSRSLDHDLYEDLVDELEREVAQGRLSKGRASPLDKDECWPSCFGLPGCRSETSLPCVECCLSDRCRKIGDIVQSKVHLKTRSFNPADRARRESQNIRKARSREKQKMAGATSPLAA